MSTLKLWQQKCDTASKYSLLLTGFFIPLSVTGLSIFFPLTVVLSLLAGRLKEKFLSLLGNRVAMATILFYALLLISISYTTANSTDVSIALHKYGKLLYVFFFMPLFVEEKWRKHGINVFILAMLVTLVASFMMKAVSWIHFNGGGIDTPFTNHINTSLLMAYAAFVVAHRCFVPSKMRGLYGIFFFIICYNLFFMNEGRTGYIVFAVLFFVFLWQKWGRKGIAFAAILIPLLLATLFAVSTDFRQRVEMISADVHHYQERQLKDNSVGLRVQFTKHSLDLIQHAPIIGTGVGSFKNEYSSHFPPDPGFAHMSNPQNEYLLVAVQLGIIGLLAFLALFYTELRQSLFLKKDYRYLAQGFVIAFMVGCLSDSLLFIAIPGYFFVYFTALFFAPKRLGEKKS